MPVSNNLVMNGTHTSPPSGADREAALANVQATLGLGQIDTARALAQALLATLDGIDLRFEARVLACLAHCDRLAAKPRRACESARRAAQLFEELGDTQGEAEALITLAHACILLGRNEEAVEAAILSTLLCEIEGPTAQTVLAYNSLGLAYCWSGDHARADASLEKAVLVAQRCVPPVGIFQPRLNQLWVELTRLVDERYQTGKIQSLAKLCQLEQDCLALQHAGQGLPLLPGLQLLWSTLWLTSVSILAIWQGDLHKARSTIEEADQLLADAPTWLDAFVCWGRAELAWAEGDWARTENELIAMRETALGVEHERFACMADLLLAQVYELQGKHAEARLAYRNLRRRERGVMAEGLGNRAPLVSWRLGARQSERRLQQALLTSKRFEQWSLEDALTGIANRRHFEQTLAQRMARALPSGEPITVGMVDVDRFKTVNDRFTHSVGDRVLKTVAAIMAAEMRENDLPARWAGDEFVVLFDNISEQQAAPICARIREAVASFDWESIAPGLRMSVSIGVSQVRPGDTAESVLHRSDEAMYSNKPPDSNSA